ncbi:uncharacterized protein LOC119728039 [Patiria miniata]|uniref:Integrase catalytic domain-containing protein n=1 Tax=Patiria miniata TaxID=46514 RepID=A0A913ZYA5_PATMI|nr:uncharacterized protein LOC119728039 [Patiria miniata]
MSTPTKSAPASTVQAKEKCQFHDIQGHRLSECIAFGRKPIQERRQFCMDRGLCFKCGSNHRMKECETKVQCRKCKSTEHASFMHINQKQNEGEVQSEKQPANSHKDVVANTKCTRFLTCSSARSCSKIVLCKIYHKDHPKNSILGYAVLDDQSNACLGGPEVFEALNLAGPAFPYELSTCGGNKITSEGRRACGLIVESQDGKTEQLPTVIDNAYIPGDRSEIPNPDLCENFPHLRPIAAKIPEVRDDINIILLVGRNCPEPLKVRESRNGPRGTPWAQQGAHTNSDGNLEFPLPFKQHQPNLPNNRPQAQSRLDNLLENLRRKPKMMSDYIAFFDKILTRNHASRVPANELCPLPGTVWYLPHFAVHHPKKPEIRVVFDASAEFKGISLNKALLQGPDMMNSLLGILLRFRLAEVAVMGDVEHMFHNFYVNTEHRDYLRFLWFDDNDPTKPTVEYRMNVHLFGSISSPAVATFGLRMVADECESTHGADVKQFIHNDFYVDDGLTSQRDAQTATNLVQRCRDALATKNLHFHKIGSNSKEVMNALPKEERSKNLKCIDLCQDELPTQRSLGVYWSLERDTLTFQVDLQDKPFSRRGVLSVASSIYDPLGLAAPVTIEGKFILRELMAASKKEQNSPQDLWDRPLPQSCLPRWTRWRNSLLNLQDIHVPRCYHPTDFGHVNRREIHVFSDASDLAKAAVAYLRLVNENNQSHVSFLLAKAKVTPPHAVSIPRLELCGAVLATTLVQTVEPEIRARAAIDSTTYYTDSKVVLGYISNRSRRFHVYVANRVHKIHNVSTPNQWHHVPTDENPADLASRSVPANQLSTSTWFRGPDFLWQQDPSPTQTEASASHEIPLDDDDPEVRRETRVNHTNVSDQPKSPVTMAQGSQLGCNRFSRFSTWASLRRAVTTLIVAVKTFKSKREGISDDNRQADKPRRRASVAELQKADRVIFHAVQKEYFGEELASLITNSDLEQASTNAIKKKSPMYQLSPFIDNDGLIRVGGRLRRADLDLGGRHQVLLPKNSHVSKLIVKHFHQEVKHQGRHFTFAAIRAGGFWVIGAHDLVRSVINQCTICAKLRGKFLTQVMADLPQDRLQPTPPFTNVGTDVFGPWTIVTRKTRGGSADSKRWAVIFTCLSTRAVHVEVIDSMDTSAFICALRRFVAVRGPVAKIRCDRGTNFVGAKGELNHEQVGRYLTTRSCEWVFNPPHASHFGGVWERPIGIIRRVLESMFAQLGKHQLTHDVLVTFMAEACAIVNSRPITTVSSDANDPRPLTPATLLTLKTQTLQAPPGDFVKEDLYARQHWRRAQYLAEQFWLRWQKEYLQSLQPRTKWNSTQPNIREGDVVLVRDKELRRNNWPLARVTKTYPSDDGRVRKVDIIVCSDGTRRTYLRPISELVLLEKGHDSTQCSTTE